MQLIELLPHNTGSILIRLRAVCTFSVIALVSSGFLPFPKDVWVCKLIGL